MNSSTATQLQPGDVVLTGHGYGETPAVVAGAGRFTKRLSIVRFTDQRVLHVTPDHAFTRAARPGEQA